MSVTTRLTTEKKTQLQLNLQLKKFQLQHDLQLEEKLSYKPTYT